MKTVFLRVLEAEDKASALLRAVNDPERAIGRQRFEVNPTSFASVPRSPFAYWVSDRVRGIFTELPAFAAEGRVAKQGLATADDFRFVRLSWEVLPAQTGERWFPFAKGGKFSPFYADVYLVVNWALAGEEIRNNLNERGGVRSNVWMLRDTAAHFFFHSGLTWPRRTNGLSMRVMPAGCIFADKGPAAFVERNDINELLVLACVTNSRPFALLVSLQLARTELAQSYEVGLIQTTPVPCLSDSDREALARLARRAWSLKRALDTRTETSHAFTLPALLQVTDTGLTARAAAWAEHVWSVEGELVAIQAEIDDRCFVLYDIDEAGRRAITEGFGTRGTEDALGDVADEEEDDAEENADGNKTTADATGLAAELLSWAVGAAFGRFDIRLSTGACPIPAEPGPFDPLPACSPGMLTGEDGLPLVRPAVGYALAYPEAGVLVDDLGHTNDLLKAARAVFNTVFDAGADRWWSDVAALLDPKDHDLRVWLAGSFFEHHLKRHSKSRRKAPIIWQLGTPSGRYSLWLYAHRLTRDTFFQLQNELVGPKLAHEERQLTSLIQNTGGSPSAQERKEMALQEAIVEELRTMLDEVKCVAPLWNPNLDDGVVLAMAPLWRLVPQHKPWQKELKSKWDELAAGKYDWTHLAMHLWPERVVPKCVNDRSFAIAHGLEDMFWIKAVDGKWGVRETPVKSVDILVRERSSPAVKASLKSLLDAPSASGSGRARSRRAAATAAFD